MSEGEQRLNASFLSGSSDDGTNSDFYDPRQSPPKAIVDSSPLQPAMDKNKESLKVKLMVRRPHSQLVEQGIIPPLKTSPAIHKQCKQLERAKTSDLLKAKIQQRPNREDLERRHILEEDECHIDPSLAEKQRMLKKARLADQLNSQIQHRPGPLELIKKNILHTEKPIEKIVKEGLVTFKATSEGLLTRPQHPNSYVTFEDDSQSSESDSTRQTPPGSENVDQTTGPSETLQTAPASRGIVTLALTIPASGGQVVVTSAPIIQTKLPNSKNSYVPPPPPPPMPNTGSIKVKQETANLYEELCQSVAGSNSNYLQMVASPGSLASSTSTLSPLSSIASPPHSATSRPIIQSPALQIAKSDAPGKDKNRKKSKSKSVSKARTIKFHEYKGPPSAAHKATLENSTTSEETSYQLMLEQQNCLLKFLETLNKNQSIIPATSGPNTTPTSSVISTVGKSGSNVINTVTTATANSSSTLALSSPVSNTLNPMQGITTEITSPSLSTQNSNVTVINQATLGNNQFVKATAPRPPPLPSPALSVCSSVPPSPATSYAESTTSSVSEVAKLEKMKVSDLKKHLKKRNLPVSGPKPQLIERLKPFLPLETLETISSIPVNGTVDSLKQSSSVEAMDTGSAVANIHDTRSIAMSPQQLNLEHEQMDVIQQLNSPKPLPLQTVMQPQPQTATIILSNEELLREQQRKIDELQRQLQKSQQELQEIRQRQQQQQNQQQQQHQQQHQQQFKQQQFQKQTVTAQVVNASPSQQITLIATTTTTATTPQNVNVLQSQVQETMGSTKVMLKAPSVKSIVAPTPVFIKKAASVIPSSTIQSPNSTQPMTQKMVVKQQLEAKIQKQKQAAAAAAAAAAQAQAQAQALAQMQTQALVQSQAQPQIRLLTQKTQTVLIPTGPTLTTTTAASKLDDKLSVQRARMATVKPTTPTSTTATIVTNQLPLTKTHNNLGLVWNEGNQTIFLVGLNDQHMTAHTIGNISLANANPVAKKFLNGHQRTNSLPSIVFPLATANNANATHPTEQTVIEAKPILTAQQLQKLHLQQHQQQQFQQILHQQHQHQHHQQIVEVDIKPQNLTAPPPPPPLPPHYEEATKHLKMKSNNNNNDNSAITLLNSFIKIKEEPTVMSPSVAATTSGVTNQINAMKADEKSGKIAIKSEKLTDVLDILVKQGELPESALEPITPITTPLTPGGGNALMSDLTESLIFQAADNQLKQETADNKQTSESLTNAPPKNLNNCVAMDTTGSPKNLSSASVGVFDFYRKSNNMNASLSQTAANNALNNFTDNIDMASPLQPDCHLDSESVAKSFDIFLEQHQVLIRGGAEGDGRAMVTQHQSPTHHDMLSKPSFAVEQPLAQQLHLSSEEAKLNHFDEFELLELMSQQLEMDIGVDSVSYETTRNNNGNIQFQQLHSDDKATIMNGLRRHMNPSLQPSISELMQTHTENMNSGNYNNNKSAVTSPVSNCSSTGNSNNSMQSGLEHHLDDFDANTFVQHLQQSHHQHDQQHTNDVNGNGTTHMQTNHSSTTPMDVCDEFDNPLSNFNFSTLSPDSNINTPPHPFGLSSVVNTTIASAMGSCGMQATTTSCGGAGTALTSAANVTHDEQMSICNATVSENTTANDSFGSGSSDIFDLFNIDDYKMSWGEGDFAV
uniref:SAP domain-containing protein n=1 Tax=Glossina brevipalpis TaxID=37001 RepID=A0A1A9WD30_9MUSC